MGLIKERYPERLYLDRASFIAWTDGILLEFHKGKGVVGDNINHERAEKVLKEGGRVFLTVDGKPVTELIETDEAYKEIEVKEEKT